jgi:hypothetical protein
MIFAGGRPPPARSALGNPEQARLLSQTLNPRDYERYRVLFNALDVDNK